MIYHHRDDGVRVICDGKLIINEWMYRKGQLLWGLLRALGKLPTSTMYEGEATPTACSLLQL